MIETCSKIVYLSPCSDKPLYCERKVKWRCLKCKRGYCTEHIKNFCQLCGKGINCEDCYLSLYNKYCDHCSNLPKRDCSSGMPASLPILIPKQNKR